MAAGADVTWTIVASVASSVADGTTLSNSASIATNNTTDPVAGNNSDTETTAVIARADLQVEKSDSPDPVIAGSNLTYTIKVTNLGPSDNSGFTLSDALPAGTSFVSATSPDCVHSAGTVTCTSTGLAAGADVTWTIVASVASSVADGTTLSNSASIATNNTTDPVAANDSDTETTAVIARADLSITKDDSVDPVTAGGALTYNITVNNAGPSDAQAVIVNDTLPAQLTGVSVSSSQGSCISFPCNLGTIAAGGNATITVTGTVNANTPDGTLLSNTATVSSSTTDPNAANDSDTETTAVIARADLSITKDDSVDPVTAGGALTYNITVNNAGPSDAQAVIVNDTLPAQLTGVSVSSSQGSCISFPCNLGTIAAGGNATITVTGTVNANTPDGTLLSNTATVSSSTTDPNAANDSDTETTAVIARADLSITKDDSVDPVTAGGALTYNITVNNAGPSDAQAVIVNDSLPAQLTGVSVSSSQGSCISFPCNLGTIAAGGNATITVTGTVNANTPDGTLLSNTATVSSSTTDPNAANDSDTETTAVIARADLSITKDDSVDPVTAGGALTYNITVNNAGPSDAQAVIVNDSLPAQLTGVSVSSSQGSCISFPCNLGTIAAGGNATITVTGTVNANTPDGTLLSNTATVSSSTTDPNAANDSDTETTAVIARADLSITKDDSVDPVTAGGALTYNITVNNAGPSDAQAVIVNDTLPAQLTGVSVSSSQGSCISFPCNLGTIAAGGNATITVTGTVNANTPDGTLLSNTATVSSSTTDPNAANDSDTETTAVIARADLSITKDDSVDPVTAGGALTYNITVNNAGPSDAQAVIVNDSLPAQLTGVSVSSSQGSCISFPCNLGTIAAGGNATITVTGTVNANTPDGTLLSNTATVSSSTTDPNAANDSDTETTAVIARADLSITKDDSVDPVTAGGALTYNITVNNAGPSDAQAVIVNDSLPAQLTGVSVSSSQGSCISFPCNLGTIAAGGNATITVTGTVNANTPDGTLLSNTATVSSSTTDPNAANDSDTETTAVIARADLSITKDDSVDPVTAGGALTYNITVNNAGPSDAQAVIVNDSLPAQLTGVSVSSSQGSCISFPCNLGTIAAGGNATITVTGTVNANTPDGTLLSNTATVSSSTTDPNAANDSDTETTAVIARADLSITKDDSVDPVTAGGALTYNITVNNAGPSDAQAVIVNDSLPAQLTGVSVSSSQGSCISFPCNLGTIAAGGNATITVTGTVNANTPDGTLLSNTATVSSSTTDPNAANDSDTETTAVIARADLSITKDDSVDPVTAGGALTYNITVNNAGPSDAQAVIVNDTLPAQLTGVSVSSSQGSCISFPCNLGTIAAGGNATITVTGTVNANTPDGTLLSNTATVSSSTTDPNAANDSDTETTAVIARADLSITKDDSVDPVTAGGALTYNITVNNAGPSDAQAVIVNDSLPAQLTGVSVSSSQGSCISFPCNLGTIAAGGNATITVTGTVNANTPDGTLLSNTATVSSSTTDPNAANDSDTETTAVIARADLSITKDDGVTQVTAGNGVTYTYTITVNNGGPSDAQAVMVNDTWPAGFTQGTITPSQGTCSGTPNFTCSLGTIAAAASATVTVNYTVPSATAAGTQTNSVTATSNTTDSDGGNNSASDTNTVLTSADLSVTKTDGVTQVTVGDGVTYTYTITVNNGGPSDALAVMLNDTWPAGFTQGTITPSQGTCSGSPNFTCNLGTIAAHGSATITVDYTVPTSTSGGPQTNSVTVTSDTSDPETGNNLASDTNTVLTPDLRVQKTANPAGPVSAGDEIGFDVTLSNIGTGTAFGVSFTDTLPNSGLSWSISPSSTGWSISGNSLIYSPTTLAAGASTTVHVKATSSSANCGLVSNTASAAASNEKAPDTGNNTATASVTVNCPDLAVSKLADASPVNAGNPIGFKITVSNIGPGEAKSVTLLDTLPSNPGMVWTVDALNSDSGCTITGTNNLSCSFGSIATTGSKKVHVTSPTTAANCGSVSNTATATATNERPSDTANNSSTAVILLNDVTAPVITLNSQTVTLWSPNHKYNTVKVTDLVASASDSCSTSLNLSSVYISKVTSDEPENINSGDGNTVKDMVIANDCKSVDLRAERDGSKNGRVYTITFKVKDAAGNEGTVSTKVTVPHSQGPKGVAVDDGPVYTVTNSLCP